MPWRCRLSARLKPQIPAPMMMTSSVVPPESVDTPTCVTASIPSQKFARKFAAKSAPFASERLARDTGASWSVDVHSAGVEVEVVHARRIDARPILGGATVARTRVLRDLRIGAQRPRERGRAGRDV